MPDEAAHARVAKSTIAAYHDTVDKHPAWGAVMLFYGALHEVERLLARQGKDTEHHAAREHTIKTHHKKIWAPYSRLRSECDKARYMKGGHFLLRPENVKRELEQGKFTDVKTYVDAQLAALTDESAPLVTVAPKRR